MRAHFQKFAAYNQWANALLFKSIAGLSEHDFHQDMDGFFGSICKTLNHILVADLIWMDRVEDFSPKPLQLNSVLHETFAELLEARKTEDQRLIRLVDRQNDNDFKIYLDYNNIAGDTCNDLKSEIFTHIFNHQSHHRGQCHHMLSQLGFTPPSLDIIYYYRSRS